MPDETFNVNVNFNADDSDAKAKLAELEAKKQLLESQGIKIKLYTDLKQSGLSETEIQQSFQQGLGLPKSDYTDAANAARLFEAEKRKIITASTQEVSAAEQLRRAQSSLNSEYRTSISINKEGLRRITQTAKTEGEFGPITTTTEVENQVRDTSESARIAGQIQRDSEKQTQAEIKETTRTLSEQAAEYDRIARTSLQKDLAGKTPTQQYERISRELQRPDLTTSQTNQLSAMQTKAESAAFNDYARSASEAEKAQQSFAAAQFQSSLRGKSLEEQLTLVQGRLGSVGQATNEYNRLIGQQASLQDRIASQPLSGSLEDLRNKVREATNAFTGDEASTKKLSEATKNLKTVQDQANEAMGKTGSAYNSLGSILERQMIRIGVGIAIWTTLRTAQREIQETIKAMQQYSIEVSRFAAVTDQSIGDAIQQYNALRDVAAQRGFTPTEAAPALLEAGRLSKTATGQQQLVTSGTGLAEFLGVDPKKAIEGLNEAMLALGASEEDTAKIADMIGAAYKRVGGDANQFLSAMTNAALISDKLGISFEQTFAAITSGAQSSGRSMDVVYSTLNRFSESLGNLSVDKTIEVARGFKELGINALDAQGQIRPVGELITDLGSRWASMSAADQEKAITLLSGNEKLKGQAYAAAKGIMDSYADGWKDGFTNVDGTIQKGLAQIDSSFGQSIKRRDAAIQAMEQQGQMAPALISKVLGGIMPYTSGASGGLESEIIAKSYQVGTFQAYEASREEVMKRVVGMTPEDAQKAVAEFNTAVMNLNKAYPLSTIGTLQYLIKPEELVNAMKNAGAQAGKALVDGFSGVLKSGGAQGKDLLLANMQKNWDDRNKITQPNQPDLSTPKGELSYRLTQYAQNPQGGQLPLTTQETDLTKYSQAEINQAKQLSIQISNQEIAALREQMALLGIAPDLINAAAAAQEKQLDATVKLLQTQQGVNYEMGKQVANLDKALSQMNNEKQQRQSSFAFQRLKDVQPEQFGQLQALAQMYNQFLTNIGSPEKSQNINLLLGDNNVFKTMNVRMTALQLALEDLTKTEKAQLAGTWNLPAGATALVPIQSLDIQRWNKSGGGGLSEEAIRALLGATEQSGTGVQTAVKSSADQISSTIRDVFAKEGIAAPLSEKEKDSGDILKIIAAGREDLLNAVNAKISQKDEIFAKINQMAQESRSPNPQQGTGRGTPVDPSQFPLAWQRQFGESTGGAGGIRSEVFNTQVSSLFSSIQNLAGNLSTLASGIGGRGGLSGGSAGSSRGLPMTRETGERQPVNVSVSALPLKATFNANLSVILNGQIVAKALLPLLYQQMIKMSNTAPTTGGGVGSLR